MVLVTTGVSDLVAGEPTRSSSTWAFLSTQRPGLLLYFSMQGSWLAACREAQGLARLAFPPAWRHIAQDGESSFTKRKTNKFRKPHKMCRRREGSDQAHFLCGDAVVSCGRAVHNKLLERVAPTAAICRPPLPKLSRACCRFEGSATWRSQLTVQVDQWVQTQVTKNIHTQVTIYVHTSQVCKAVNCTGMTWDSVPM